MIRHLFIACSILFSGCALDLGSVPFLCHSGSPRCPGGYHCVPRADQAEVCVKDGVNLDAAVITDADSAVDAAPVPDIRSSSDQQQPPLPELVFTEFMADPSAATQVYGEWFELFNPAEQQAVDITGWIIRSGPGETHVIRGGSAVVIPPQGFLVLGKSKDTVVNGGVKVGYVYEGIQLAETADELVLENPSSKIIDSFVYSTASGFIITEGASLSVKHPASNKNLPASWCTEPQPWDGSKGDRGTPGASLGCF